MVKKFRISTIKEGYGKGTFIIKDSTGRTYMSGGLLKTPTRAKNWLKKMQNKYNK